MLDLLEKVSFLHPADVVKEIPSRFLEGVNVVFVNMPLRETAAPNTTPEGPLLMATNLRDNFGVNASVVDLNGYRVHDVEAERRGLKNGRHLTLREARFVLQKHFQIFGEPDLVAFSGMITTLRWQENLAKIVRELEPEAFLVSGNGLATELKMGLFTYIPELDGVAHSEGDDVILKIVHDAILIRKEGMDSALSSGKLNPYYQGFITGRHRFLYAGDRPKDLDLIPRADLDFLKNTSYSPDLLERYLKTPVWGTAANNSSATSFTMERSTTFVSSRGCPFDCGFCFRGSQGERKWGLRSARSLADHIRSHVNKYGVDFVGMPDDNFAVSRPRIMELPEAFDSLGVRWGTHLRLDEAADLRPKGDGSVFESPKRVDMMAKAGCVYIGFGAESASSKVLEAMNKGGFILSNGTMPVLVNGHTYDFPRTMIEGIRNSEHAGIHANCTWIMAYPKETLDDLKMSVAFMIWQEEFYRQAGGKSAETVNKRMFVATWYPGTAMGRMPKVMETLKTVFGLSFDEFGVPVCDENFHRYLLELDDATKLLVNPATNEPLNFSDMPMDTFLHARELADSGKTYDILSL